MLLLVAIKPPDNQGVYHGNTRLEVSRHLEQRRLRLTDVADLLGYSSLSAFSNWYRGRFGETPSEARHRSRRRSA